MRKEERYSIFLPDNTISAIDIDYVAEEVAEEVREEVFEWNKESLAPCEFATSDGTRYRFVRMESDHIGQLYLVYRTKLSD